MKSNNALAFTALSIVCAGFSALFWYAFYWRYWKYADCIAQVANGSCIEDDSMTTSGGMIWAVPATFFALLAVVGLYAALRRKIRLR